MRSHYILEIFNYNEEKILVLNSCLSKIENIPFGYLLDTKNGTIAQKKKALKKIFGMKYEYLEISKMSDQDVNAIANFICVMILYDVLE